ncbi:hypothetical protein [Empedobacter tilapiae]
MGRDHLAALIGALAKGNFTIISGGAAMNDGTCFPSVTHINGQSIDTEYLSSQKTQEFIDALAYFGFNSFYYSANMKLIQPKNAITFKGEGGHKHHLHAGAETIKVKEINL